MESKIRKLLYSYMQCKKDRDELYDEIAMVKARIASIYGGCHGGAADDIHVINGSIGDPVYGAVVGQVIPEREHLDRLMQRLEVKVKAIETVERYLDYLDALERSVIECRYFKRMTWPNVSTSTYLSISTTYRIHEGAMRKLNWFELI